MSFLVYLEERQVSNSEFFLSLLLQEKKSKTHNQYSNRNILVGPTVKTCAPKQKVSDARGHTTFLYNDILHVVGFIEVNFQRSAVITHFRKDMQKILFSFQIRTIIYSYLCC